MFVAVMLAATYLNLSVEMVTEEGLNVKCKGKEGNEICQRCYLFNGGEFFKGKDLEWEISEKRCSPWTRG